MNRFFLAAEALGLCRPFAFSRHWAEHAPSEEAAFDRALACERRPLMPRLSS
ncbi:hypothetical protein [Pararhodospirillum photometricum]|nr:hypothetical protein [Pararhodospirillum photometricum]